MTGALWRWALLAFALSAVSAARAEPVATAVLPFSEAGAEARGLGPAFADMLTTDLGVTAELRLLERKNLAAVLGELDLQRGGLVDPSTASRMGKLIGAELVVVGQVALNGDALRLDARLVSVERGEVLGAVKVEGTGAAFFEAEAKLAKALLGELGVSLSKLAALKLDKPHTRSLPAARVYGEGLERLDKGDEAAAKTAFEKALAADPVFSKAQAALAAIDQRVSALERSGGLVLKPTSPADFWNNAQIHLERDELGPASEALAKLFEVWRAAGSDAPPHDALMAWGRLGKDSAALGPFGRAALALGRRDPVAALSATAALPTGEARDLLRLEALTMAPQTALGASEEVALLDRLAASDLSRRFVSGGERDAMKDRVLKRLATWDEERTNLPPARMLVDPPARIRFEGPRRFLVVLAEGPVTAAVARLPGGREVPLAPAAPAEQKVDPKVSLTTLVGELDPAPASGVLRMDLRWTGPGGPQTFTAPAYVPLVERAPPNLGELSFALRSERPLRLLVDPLTATWTAPVAPGPHGVDLVFDPIARGSPTLGGALLDRTQTAPPQLVFGRPMVALDGERVAFVGASLRTFLAVEQGFFPAGTSDAGLIASPDEGSVWPRLAPLLLAGKDGASARHAVDLGLALVTGAESPEAGWRRSLRTEDGALTWVLFLATARRLGHRVDALAEGLARLPARLPRRPWIAALADAAARGDVSKFEQSGGERLPRDEAELAALRAALGLTGPTGRLDPALVLAARRGSLVEALLVRALRDAAQQAGPVVPIGGRFIDRWEVTVDDWRACEAAGACRPISPAPCEGEPRTPALAGFGSKTPTAAAHCYDLEPNPFPATWVPHADAAAYCAWRGGGLPTAKDWAAALGPDPIPAEGREARGNLRDRWSCMLRPRDRRGKLVLAKDEPPCGPEDRWDGWGGPAPVGVFPAGRAASGAEDLLGNVREWLADGRAAGGSWLSAWRPGLAAEITPEPSLAAQDLGFRCAYPRAPAARPGKVKRTPEAAAPLAWRAVPAGWLMIRFADELTLRFDRKGADRDAFVELVVSQVPALAKADLAAALDLLAARDPAARLRSDSLVELYFRGLAAGLAPAEVVRRLAALADANDDDGLTATFGLAREDRAKTWVEDLLSSSLGSRRPQLPPIEAPPWEQGRAAHCLGEPAGRCRDTTGFIRGIHPPFSWVDFSEAGRPDEVLVPAFEILEVEVTRAQYLARSPSDPSWERCPGCAMSRVDFAEAERFCASIGGRLPTEAQWLWAQQSGRLTAPVTIPPRPELRPTARQQHPEEAPRLAMERARTATRRPAAEEPADHNGVRGLLGGLWEWVDAQPAGRNADERVVVGGSYLSDPRMLSWHGRVASHRAVRSDFVGFRCVR